MTLKKSLCLISTTAALFVQAPAARAVSLIHTNDVLGEIEPCGCRNNPLGGFARKANLLKRLDDREFIQVDAGDLLFATNTVPELLAEQSEVQATYLLKSMRELKHDAITPGEKDFALGLKKFEKLAKDSGISFVSANLKRRNGKSLFESHRVFTRKDASGKPVRVAVFGLSGKDIAWPKELKVDDPIAAARALVPRLRKEADFVIALTHQGLEADRKLAAAVPGIDVIAGGHTQSFIQEPTRTNGAWIVQSSFLNQYIGVLPLQRSMRDGDPAETAKKYQLTALDGAYDSPAEAPGRSDELVREFKKKVAEVNTRRENALGMSGGHAPSGGNPQVAKYQTFPRCASCHLPQFDFWRKTPHALAFHSLVKQSQSKNKECLSCHTVGLGDPEGTNDVSRLARVSTQEGDEVALPEGELDSFIKSMHEAKDLKSEVKTRVATTARSGELELRPLSQAVAGLSRAYTPVQCENCHQPGRDHPFSANYTKAVPKETCLKCHTVQRAPEWYEASGQPDWKKIEEKRAKITCPAGELPPED